jgi:hypothetical protein
VNAQYNHLKNIYNRNLSNYYTFKTLDNNMDIDSSSFFFLFFFFLFFFYFFKLSSQITNASAPLSPALTSSIPSSSTLAKISSVSLFPAPAKISSTPLSPALDKIISAPFSPAKCSVPLPL